MKLLKYFIRIRKIERHLPDNRLIPTSGWKTMGVKKKVIENSGWKDEKWITSAPVEVSYTSHGRWKLSTPPQCPERIVTQVDGGCNTVRHHYYWNMSRNADRLCQWVSNELAMVQDEYILERNAPTDNCDVRTPRKSLPGNLMPAKQLRCVAPPLLPQLLPSTWSHVWPTQTTSAAAAWLTTERRALGQRKRERVPVLYGLRCC